DRTGRRRGDEVAGLAVVRRDDDKTGVVAHDRVLHPQRSDVVAGFEVVRDDDDRVGGRDVLEARREPVGTERAGQSRAESAVQGTRGGVNVLRTDEAAGQLLDGEGFFVGRPGSDEEAYSL